MKMSGSPGRLCHLKALSENIKVCFYSRRVYLFSRCIATEFRSHILAKNFLLGQITRWIRATKYFLPSLLRSGKSHFMNGYGQKFFLQNNVPIYTSIM